MTKDNQGEIEFRCECGNLIFKVTDEGIELKCKRCKRIKLIPFSKVERRGDLLNYIR